MNSTATKIKNVDLIGMFPQRSILSFAFCLVSVLPLTAYGQLPADAPMAEPAGQNVIFRYRTYTTATAPSSVSQLDPVSLIDPNGNILPTSIKKFDRGIGFDDFNVTSFDGTSDFVRGKYPINTSRASGDDSFTVEAWFSPASNSTEMTLFTNTFNATGFALRIFSGRLRGEVNFHGASTQVVTMNAEEASLVNGRWYYAVLHVQRGYFAPDTGTPKYYIRLFLNGNMVGSIAPQTFPGGVYQADSRTPLVGAEPGVPKIQYFKGDIYGVTVSNHAVNINSYVTNSVIRDGSNYITMPEYHDYLTNTADVEYRISQSENKIRYTYDAGSIPSLRMNTETGGRVQERMLLPFLNDEYVPQGIGYDPAGNGRFYIAYYYKEYNGSTGDNSNNGRSFVAEIDRTTKKLRRVLQLKAPGGGWHYGHCGGLEFDNGNLYVTEGKNIYRYDLSQDANTAVFNSNTFAVAAHDLHPLSVSGNYALDLTVGSDGNGGNGGLNISNFNGRKILWVTNAEGSSDAGDGSPGKFIFGFQLNANGTIGSRLYAFRMPLLNVQGVACCAVGTDGINDTSFSFYYTRGGVLDTSGVYKVTFTNNGGTWSSDSLGATRIICLARGIQEPLLLNGSLWLTSESGAGYYQKRSSSPFDELYPFLYSDGISLTVGSFRRVLFKGQAAEVSGWG